MDDLILITELNDFVFCPISIYFHHLYGDQEKVMYQSEYQLKGTAAHSAVDNGSYSDKNEILQGMDVYCEKYGLIGKIDIFDIRKKVLRERKKRIKVIYDGYVFQVYAQYFALKEMGYEVNKIELYSIDDHKTHKICLPEDDLEMLCKFEMTIHAMKNFDMESFIQNNPLKCVNCIYEPACDRSMKEDTDA